MKYFLFVFCLVCFHTGLAQITEVRVKGSVPNPSFILKVQEPNVDIEGYSGSELIIQMVPIGKEPVPAGAEGLRKIPIKGRGDEKQANVLNPKIVENPAMSSMTVTIARCECSKVIIKVPKDSVLLVEPQAFGRNGRLYVKNIDNEVQVLGWSPHIELENVAGFFMSTGAGSMLSSKIVLSNIQWSDKMVMFNGAARPRNFSVNAVSANVYLKMPQELKGYLLYGSKSGEYTTSLSTRFSDAAKPTPQQIELFSRDLLLEPYLRFHKLNGGGDIKIKVTTVTGSIHISMEN